MTKSNYVMSKCVLNRLKNRFGEVRCRSCGGEIEVGDRVVTSGQSSRRFWIRHEGCYERSLIKERK